MTSPIRVAVLSFAHYHANFWSEVFKASPLATLTAIWDDDAARGRGAAATHAVPFEADLDTVLAGCDAVAICSETARHADLIERAARAGRAILCEKPLATSLAECGRIRAAVARVLFMQSFPKRFDPVNLELKRRLEAREFGRIGLVRVRHGHFYGRDAGFAASWHAKRAASGGGTLIDEGVHGADFLRWMFGEPVAVTAVQSSALLGLDVEDLAIATYRYADGMLAELVTSWNFVAAENSIEVYGQTGSAIVGGVDLASKDFCNAAWLKTYTGGERTWTVSDTVPRFKQGGFHQQNALAFLDALAHGKSPPITLEDGARALAMILAAYEAAALGREVTIRFE
ncbi:MAG: Gfo/Idh/MocA family oxidoreductase [Burkholderiales bacterium]|nr:Gfo/Idh/MocA family oxidoreductase [Burkholderiales bacterium]